MRWVVDLQKEKDQKTSSNPIFSLAAGSPRQKDAKPLDETSGHTTYKLVNVESDGLLHFFKLNKNNSYQLSLIEVMMTSLWNWSLPRYTSICELVFEHDESAGLDSWVVLGSETSERHHRISGVISKSVPPGIKIKRKFDPKAPNVDMFSMAGTWVNNHFKFEDDFHRKNGVIVEFEGILYSFRYDFDMTGQDLAETDDLELAELGFSANRRGTPSNLGKKLAPRGAEIAVVAKEDIISLPIPVKHDPWFAPGKTRAVVGGDKLEIIKGKSVPVLKSLVGKSTKGWDGDSDFLKNYTTLSKNPEFIKWKWYHYARNLFTPRWVSISVMYSRIKMITNEKEKNFATGISSRIGRWETERRKKFEAELLKIPEFVQALCNHKSEFLQQMQKDTEIFVNKFGCPLELKKIEKEMASNYNLFIQKGLQQHPKTDTVDENLWAGAPISITWAETI